MNYNTKMSKRSKQININVNLNSISHGKKD